MSNSVYANNTDVYENICVTEYTTKKQETKSNKGTSEHNTSGHGGYRLAVVCLLVILVLMLVAIAILWVKLTTERDRIQTSYNNITNQRDLLVTSYNNVTAEKDQLEIRYKKVSEERDQFQRKTDELQKKISQNMRDINTPGWKYFSSSIYFISTEKKNWIESKHDCMGRGADLVIINSREEQDFVEVWRKGEGAWIGANDRNIEGVWKWVDGTTVSNGFWSNGEPNNKGDEDCAVSGYRAEPVPNWVDVYCSNDYIWICEKRVNS
ncbi:CD209 antigen-like protein C [Tachysurus ichikawai]